MTGSSTVAITGFGIAVTIGAYALSLLARRRYPSPLTTPVLFSTVIIIAILLAAGISFSDYKPAKGIMTFLLGPATVALAIPLYKNRQAFFLNLIPAGIGLLAGSLGTMITAGLIARLFRFRAGTRLLDSDQIDDRADRSRDREDRSRQSDADGCLCRHHRNDWGKLRTLVDGSLGHYPPRFPGVSARHNCARTRYRTGSFRR